MDIFVRNAFEKIKIACERADSFRQKKKNELTLEKLLAEDIHSFILLISKNGADERYSYFNKVYQEGAYPSSELEHIERDGLPGTFIILNEFDSSLRSKVHTASLYIAFISELANYYLHSRFDRKDIDIQKCKDYIQLLKDSAPRRIENQVTDNTKASAEILFPKDISQRTEPEKNNEGTEPEKAVNEVEREESLEELLEKLNLVI